MPEGQRPRAAAPHLRPGAEAGRTPCQKGSGQEELPHVRGQEQWLRVPGCDGAGTAEKSYPSPRSGAAAGRSYPRSEVRGGGREELPHVQGAVAAWAQEGLEEISHIEGQGRSEETPLFQGKEQRLHFAGAAVKRYPTSKVRETQVRW